MVETRPKFLLFLRQLFGAKVYKKIVWGFSWRRTGANSRKHRAKINKEIQKLETEQQV